MLARRPAVLSRAAESTRGANRPAETKGELADGIAAEPEKFIPQKTDFEEKWRTLDEAYAVMSPTTYRELHAAGLPMTVMVSDPRRIFVARGRWPPVAATAPAKAP